MQAGITCGADAAAAEEGEEAVMNGWHESSVEREKGEERGEGLKGRTDRDRGRTNQPEVIIRNGSISSVAGKDFDFRFSAHRVFIYEMAGLWF